MEPKNNDKQYVFISYSRANKETIKKFIYLLDKEGICIWFDGGFFSNLFGGLIPGDKFEDKLKNAIENARYFVIFLSQDSIKSESVFKEFKIALKTLKAKKKAYKIIPIRLNDITINDIKKVPELAPITDYQIEEYSNDQRFLNKIIEIFNADVKKCLKAMDTKVIPIYILDKSGKLKEKIDPKTHKQKLASRREIHEQPLWHRTVIILPVILAKENGSNTHYIIYVRKPQISRVAGGKLDVLGGHMEITDNNDPINTAVRELAEEAGISENQINRENFVLIGDFDEFGVENTLKKTINGKEITIYNYEKSTVYLYFFGVEEALGLNLREGSLEEGYTMFDRYLGTLDNLYKMYIKKPDDFADGLSRIFAREDAVKKIRTIIKNKLENL